MKRIVSTILSILVGLTLFGQQFEPKEYEGLKYQVLDTSYSGSESSSLIVFLHGGHARGEDNQTQIALPAVHDIRDYIGKHNIPAIFLVPQCPSGHEWIPNRGNPDVKEKLLGLIKEYSSKENIDPERIYIASVSMGSWASWVLVKENPELFAAALIASGRPDRVLAEDLTGTPLYVTVGSLERTLDPIKNFVSSIKKSGGSVQFDVLAGLDHPRACNKAFSDKRLRWLFSQKNTTRIMGKKTLVVFFSHAGDNYSVGNIKVGNTKIVADYISSAIGADQFEIVASKDYDIPYNDLIEVAKDEAARGELPPYVGDIDTSPYEVVFIGGPIWWGTYPQVMFTFFKNHDLNDKIIVPFTTHEGSGLASTVQDVKKAWPGATIKPGFAIYGHDVRTGQAKVERWLESLGLK